MSKIIGNLAPEKVLFLFVLGFVAMSPMMLYYYILNNELDQNKIVTSFTDKLDHIYQT